MSTKRAESFAKAMRLLDEGCAQDALRIGDNLASSDNESDRLSGYLCRGFVYEDGGKDLQSNYDRSIYNFRQAALMAPDSITFCSLARVSMKMGGVDGYAAAQKYLDEAGKLGMTSQVILGLAYFHRTRPNKCLRVAKRFYLKAACRGRYMGFFGYSEVARDLGQNVRALCMDSIRYIFGPVIALLIGRRAQDRF